MMDSKTQPERCPKCGEFKLFRWESYGVSLYLCMECRDASHSMEEALTDLLKGKHEREQR